VTEAGKGFAQLRDRPEEEAFSLLAVAVERRSGVDKAGEPSFDGIDVVLR